MRASSRESRSPGPHLLAALAVDRQHRARVGERDRRRAGERAQVGDGLGGRARASARGAGAAASPWRRAARTACPTARGIRSAREARTTLQAANASAAIPVPTRTPSARSIEVRRRAYSRAGPCLTEDLYRGREGEEDVGMSSATTISSYEQACSQHRWEVPERYNIATDVCDRHPREKPAMVHEDFHGNVRNVSWGELQDAVQPLRQRARRARGRARRSRRDAAACDARDGGGVLRHLEGRSDPALDVGPLRRRGNPPPADRLAAQGARHQRGERRPHGALAGRARADPRRRAAQPRLDLVQRRRHGGRRPGPALLLVGDDRAGQGDPPRPPLHPRPRGVPLLPRRPGRRAVPRHGRVGLGGRDLPADRAVADGCRPGRLPARGRVRPAQAARVPVQARGQQRVRHADGDPLDDVDRRRRDALPAEVQDRVLGRRAAEPGGDPLVPGAVRDHRARLLRAHRVLSAVRQLPVHGGARGLDGQADAGVGGGDPRRGRASAWPRASAARSA